MRTFIMENIVSEPQEVLVRAGTSFEETIKGMDQHKKSIALIVDEENRLLGIVTDGDIRRAILSGITPGEDVRKVMNQKPFCLNPGYANGEMVRIMVDKNVFHLPIIDEHKKVKGIVFKKTFTQQKIVPCPVVIMAGGMGSRLMPLTEETPKPLLPISGKPIIVRIVEKFRDEGAQDFFICVNYKGLMIEDYLGDGSRWRVRINYIRETDSLGTAGGLSLLPEMDSPFFVTNADVLASINFKAMYQFHRDNGATVTMAIKKIHLDVPYGTVTLKHNSIVDLSEKPSVENYVNAGIYIIDNKCLEEIPENTHYDMTDLIARLLSHSKKIAGYLIDEDWTDIGQIHDYIIANGEIPHDFKKLAAQKNYSI
jgi:dTDP-glucose pyrophosphorylase/predicted transcriptional regulator